MQHFLFAAFLCVVFGDAIQTSIFEDGQDHFIDTTEQDGARQKRQLSDTTIPTAPSSTSRTACTYPSVAFTTPGPDFVAECVSVTNADGPRCRWDGFCGCEVDIDCFDNIGSPVCDPLTKVCVACFSLRDNIPNETVDHDFCVNRYPGYLTKPGTTDTLGMEWIAAVTDAAGVVQVDSVTGAAITRPTDQAQTYPWNRAVCKRSGTNAGRCVNCMSVDLDQDLADTFNVMPSELTAPYTAWFPANTALTNAQQVDIVSGFAGTYFCSVAATNAPVCNHRASLDYLATIRNDGVSSTFNPATNGACQGCSLDNECVHPAYPLCNRVNGACIGCRSNTDCMSIDSSRPNCQANGQCVRCTIGSPCVGSLNPLHTVCGADFTCGARVVCATNEACGLTSQTPNCGASGDCYRCTEHSDCGALDLGAEHICDFTAGVCTNCERNSECIQTIHGPNCQANGRCITCAPNDSTCGVGLDGGQFPNQPLCNGGVCTEACVRNSDCGVTRGGNNCQATGHCLTCTNTINGDVLNSCGPNIDGGENPGQDICDEGTGICIDDFSCNSNTDCLATAGANCQFNNRCVTCNGATCGSLDGGVPNNQPNCNMVTGLCVDGCTNNLSCVNTQGDNCMVNGICRTCLRNEDCGTNDGGEVAGQTRCNVTNGQCEEQIGCDRNTDCSGNPNGPNCNKDGNCIRCTDANKGCGGTDGGFIQNQPICGGNGICTDIDDCETNADCQADSNVGNNCMVGGVCTSCVESSQCGNNDAGLNSRQPSCNRATGLCEEFFCDVNEDCVTQFGDSSPNCQADRTCRRCTNDGDCGNIDGGIPSSQPHCNRISGLCTNACTENSHCNDLCRPFCSLEKSCCVECLEDQHCPHPEWVGELARDFDVCSSLDNTCAKGCKDDGDCGGSLACRPATGTCVLCVSDTHCSGTTPACHTGSGECVQCTADIHCPSGACHIGSFSCVACTIDANCPGEEYCTSGSQCEECLMSSQCGEDEECVDYNCESSASSIAVGFFIFFLSFYQLV